MENKNDRFNTLIKFEKLFHLLLRMKLTYAPEESEYYSVLDEHDKENLKIYCTRQKIK